MSSSSSSAAESGEATKVQAALSTLQLHPAANSTDADAAEEDSLTLSGHFYRAQRRYHELFGTGGSSSSGSVQRSESNTNSLIRSLTRLEQRVESTALFSSNEESLDELPTSSIKFLLVPAYLSSALSSAPCGMASRLKNVEAAVHAARQFVSRAQQYGIVGSKAGQRSDTDAAAVVDDVTQFNALYKEFMNKLTAPSSVASSSSFSSSPARPPLPSTVTLVGAGGRKLDPASQRQAKIARFKREKELASQIESYRLKRRGGGAGGSASSKSDDRRIGSSSSASLDDEEAEELADAQSDEESLRKFYTLLIRSHVASAVDMLRSSVEEVDLLKYFRDIESQKTPMQRQKEEEEARRRSAPGGTVGSIGTPAGKPVMFKMTPESLNQPIPDHMKHLLHSIPRPSPPPASAVAAAGPPSSSASASAVPVSSISSNIDSLIASRAQSRDQVFRLTNQPTYSIEQWAEKEIAEGRMPGPQPVAHAKQWDGKRILSAEERDQLEQQFAQRDAQARKNQRGGADTDNETDKGVGHEDGEVGRLLDEAKTYKDRDWDNWKDDHQKGVGNSMK